MIERATSIQFNDQVQGTFNRPVISLCRTSTGLQTYFLKYPRNSNEPDGLFSELVCHELAIRLHLNTPDVALVKIGRHPVDKERIVHHEKFKAGIRVFGSKGLNKADELSQLNFTLNKHDFKRLECPPHILRIGLFDLWIGNADRKGDNYNLFLSQGRKQKIYVFDHFEAFAKITENSQTDIPEAVDVWQGILGTNFGYGMLQWVKKEALIHETNSFIQSIRSMDIQDLLTSVLKAVPESWRIKDKTIRYIQRFLTNGRRLKLIEADVNTYINYLPLKP